MTKEPLIVGIDPGITTAYAVLDTKGNLIKLKSSKRLTLSILIDELLQVEGKIIAVGSDVRHPPHYITKFCSAFNARVLNPREDMKVGFKERVTSNFKTNDDHQRDALAAAVFAYNELRPLMQKVELSLKERGKEHLVNEVKELVVNGLSITDSLEKIERRDSVPRIKKRIRQKVKKSKRVFEENMLLRERNDFLSKEIDFLKRRMQKLERDRSTNIESRIKELIDFKDRKIASLKRSIEEYQRSMSFLKADASKLRSVILNTEGKKVLRRFKSLSKEIAGNLKANEVIYVDDPGSIGLGILDVLKNGGIKVVSRSKPSKDLDRTGLFIDASDTELEILDECAIISNEELEKKRNQTGVLYKIISEYKESRS